MILFGVIMAAVFTVQFSKWAIASEIRNMEAQKGFITNASRELKTPLSVIKANTEMLEMTGGGNEWTDTAKNSVRKKLPLLLPWYSIVKQALETTRHVISRACFLPAEPLQETAQRILNTAFLTGVGSSAAMQGAWMSPGK